MANDRLGAAVAGAGDVNNDGYADILVGVPQFDVPAVTVTGKPYLLLNAGQVQVYSGRTGLPLYTFNGVARNDLQGSVIAGAGDVDGDTYDDMVVGVPQFDVPAVTVTGKPYLLLNAGQVTVYSGQTGSPLYAIQGSAKNDWLGAAAAGAGDIDNDGYADMVVGVPLFDVPAVTVTGKPYLLLNAGQVRVYSGQTGSLLLSPFNGAAKNDLLGAAVASAGDVDDDGTLDVVAGAYLHDVPYLTPLNKPALRVDAGQAVVYSGLDGSVLRSLDGENRGDHFGWSVSGGDMDGDDRSDILVGAPQYDLLLPYLVRGRPAFLINSGAVYVYSGDPGLGLLFMDKGLQKASRYGASVCASGDVNGDGYADIMVGAPLFDAGLLLDAGSMTVFSGKTATAP